MPADRMQSISQLASDIGDSIKQASGPKLKGMLNDLIKHITLSTTEITISFNLGYLSEALGIDFSEGTTLALTKPITIRRRGQEMKMVIGGDVQQSLEPDHVLIKLIAKAHLLKTELESGVVTSIKDFSIKHQMDHGDAKNLVPLAYLAPSIIEDILQGRQPVDLTARRLKYMSGLPLSWQDQRQCLGFN